jgi:hypothetical protein
MLHKISRRSKTQNFQVNPVVNHWRVSLQGILHCKINKIIAIVS